MDLVKCELRKQFMNPDDVPQKQDRKEPLWRETQKTAQSLHRPWRRKIDIPVYLNRWLVVYGGKSPEEAIPGILEQAMLLYFAGMHRTVGPDGHEGHDYKGHLLAGRYVSGNEATLCDALLEKMKTMPPDVLERVYHCSSEPGVICVSNGLYAYFFGVNKGEVRYVDKERPIEESGPFMRWMKSEWDTSKLRIKDLLFNEAKNAVVIRLKKGSWPLHPRLIPGHPLGKRLQF